MITNRSVSGLAVAVSAPLTPASVETAVWARGCATDSRHRANATARARSFLIELAGIFALGQPRKSIWEPRNHSKGAHRIPLNRVAVNVQHSPGSPASARARFLGE